MISLTFAIGETVVKGECLYVVTFLCIITSISAPGSARADTYESPEKGWG